MRVITDVLKSYSAPMRAVLIKNKCHWWCARTATPNCIIINGSSSKLFILYRFLAHGKEKEEVDQSKDCGDSKDDEEGVLVVHRSKSNRVSRWTIWLLGVSKSVLYFEYQYYKKYQLDISTALRTVESFIVTKKSWQRKCFSQYCSICRKRVCDEYWFRL